MRMGKVAVLALALALAVGMLFPTPVLAQQGNEQQITETAGPYEIGVTAIPSTLSLGRVRFIITVLEAVSRQPVPDAEVLIRTRKEGEVTGGWALALSNPEVPERYLATVNMDDPGTWTVQVEVSSALGHALVEVPPVEILTARRLTAGSFIFLGVFLVLILGGVYLWWSVRRRRNLAARLSPQDSAEEAPHRVEPGPGATGPDPDP